MIERHSVIHIGKVNKTHGVRGEMSISLDYSLDPTELRCLIFDMEGILVPFFTTNSRPRGSESWLITIDSIDSDIAASNLVGKDIFALREDKALTDDEIIEDDGFFLEDLIGWDVYDTDKNLLGTIEDIDSTTINLLFVITRNDNNTPLLVPATAEFIADFNKDAHSITLSLPLGLIDLN